jgi:hypothetical protein
MIRLLPAIHAEAAGADAIVDTEGVEVPLMREMNRRRHGIELDEPEIALSFREDASRKTLPRGDRGTVGRIA